MGARMRIPKLWPTSKNLSIPADTTTSWTQVAIVTLVSVTCYYPSFRCGLVFDDMAAIRDNKDVRPYTPLSHLFWHDFWGTPIHKEESHKSYRPLTVLTFRWNYSLHGLDPWGYHFTNVVLHTLVSLLFLSFCRIFFRRSESLVAALLFSVHPIHTDAVVSIVGRAELLSALFFLTALLNYCRRPQDKDKIAWSQLWTTVFLSWMGTLCKEQGLTVLLVCAVYDIVMRYQILQKKGALYSLFFVSRKSSPCHKTLLLRLGLLVGTFLIALVARIKIMGQHFPSFSKFDNPAAAAEMPTRQLTFNYLVAFNAWLLLFPCDLCCDWTSESVPLVRSILDVRNIVTVALYITITKLVYHLVVKEIHAALMSLCLTAITFLPASNLFFPLGFVIAERVLYLPSMGFCMLIALGWGKLHERRKTRTVSLIALGILLLFHGLKTTKRSFDWKDELSLYKSGIAVNPRNVKLLNNMGRILEKLKHDQEALMYYKEAVRVQPENVATYLNLGNAYARTGYLQEAEEAYRKAKELLPQPIPGKTYESHVTLVHLQALLRLASVISRNSSRTLEAEQLYSLVLSMRSDYKVAYSNWGNLMLQTNRPKQATVVLKKALEEEENDPDMLYNLGVVVSDQGNLNDALALFDRALSLDPHHEASLLASARLIQDEGLSELQDVAFERLKKLVDLGRADETVYFNLGMLAIKQGSHRSAEMWLQQAIKMKHNFSEALYNMALLLYRDQRPLEAAVFLRSLLKQEDHIQGLLLLADIHVTHIKDLKTAERLYEKVLHLDPTNYQGHHNLCVVYVERKSLEKAVECFRQAHLLAPNVPYIQHHLQVVKSMLQKQKEAAFHKAAENQQQILSTNSIR